ncbi:MAG TPA: alpha/beta fold hydrolase [Bryobacteraceae bacterium]|nr:alpha/beta fold hydrolase [Bryobacteraceae bacterium]
MTNLFAGPKEVSCPTQDGGVIYADLYGTGDRGVVLAHGMKFDKASWKEQAVQLANAGFLVAAVDFRGYGKSHGGPKSQSPRDEMYLDVLAAVDYLRGHGAKTVAVIGASMGGGASANAVVKGTAGAIDRLVLLAPVPIQSPEQIAVPKLYATAQGDPITPQVKEQYEKAPEPKELLMLDGAAHAQFLFTTDQSERLMREILRFLSAAKSAEGASKP